jgi:hypothetical protein
LSRVGAPRADLHRSGSKTLTLQLLTQVGQPAAQGIACCRVARMHLDRDLAMPDVHHHLYGAEVLRVQLQTNAVASVSAQKQG